MSALLEPSAPSLGRTLQKRSVGAEPRSKRGNFWSKRSQGGSSGASQNWHLANQYQVIFLGKKWQQINITKQPNTGEWVERAAATATTLTAHVLYLGLSNIKVCVTHPLFLIPSTGNMPLMF